MHLPVFRQVLLNLIDGYLFITALFFQYNIAGFVKSPSILITPLNSQNPIVIVDFLEYSTAEILQ